MTQADLHEWLSAADPRRNPPPAFDDDRGQPEAGHEPIEDDDDEEESGMEPDIDEDDAENRDEDEDESSGNERRGQGHVPWQR